jgi:hypothetical protein
MYSRIAGTEYSRTIGRPIIVAIGPSCLMGPYPEIYSDAFRCALPPHVVRLRYRNGVPGVAYLAPTAPPATRMNAPTQCGKPIPFPREESRHGGHDRLFEVATPAQGAGMHGTPTRVRPCMGHPRPMSRLSAADSPTQVYACTRGRRGRA